MTIYKEELIKSISEKANIKTTDAKAALDAMLECVCEAVADGNTVQIAKFGKFEPSVHPERKGINPRKKEPIVIAAYKTMKFKPSKTLKRKA